MTFRSIPILILLAIAGLNQPAQAASTGAGNQPTPRLQQPKNPSDSQIERTIKAKLAKSKLNADHFTVTVEKGVATFEGKTGVMQHKGTATRIAKTSGATAVRNNIRISDDAKAVAIARLAKNRSTAPSITSSRAPTKVLDEDAASIPRASVLQPQLH